ncbi:hypothetical protein C8R46DRAFT_1222577 [Mycena filopes]|nr:hypothetical protein C8R46DRAFT_1222577 [Mycena filopes]
MSLPQELLNAIVGELGDDEGALTATQGLHPVRICSPTVWNLLRSSPHIVKYVTQIVCTLPPETRSPPGETEALMAVFKTLTSVRSCHIIGKSRDQFQGWPGLTPASLAVLEFIGRQNLEGLHIFDAGIISPVVLAIFLSAAPTISILDCSVDTTVLGAARPLPVPMVKNLFLDSCPTVVNLLMLPEFASHMDIQRLWLEPQAALSHEFISHWAKNLRHMKLAWEEPHLIADEFRILPRCSLPLLQSVELELAFDDRNK